jgi:hypothetical protein
LTIRSLEIGDVNFGSGRRSLKEVFLSECGHIIYIVVLNAALKHCKLVGMTADAFSSFI